MIFFWSRILLFKCLFFSQTRPKIGFKSGSFGFIKYIIGLNPNLTPFWGQPEPKFDPFLRSTWPVWNRFLIMMANSTHFNPKTGLKIRLNTKKQSGLAALLGTVLAAGKQPATILLFISWAHMPKICIQMKNDSLVSTVLNLFEWFTVVIR